MSALLSLETPHLSADEVTEDQPSDADRVSTPDQFYEAGRERLTELLSERKLRGVAYFDFTNFKGD